MTKQKGLDHGFYMIFWKEGGGHSLAAVGYTHDGTNWYAPCNWTATDNIKPEIASTDWGKVERIELLIKNQYPGNNPVPIFYPNGRMEKAAEDILSERGKFQSPTTADASVLKAAWNMAITIANNECMIMSDDWNNDDDIEKADAANQCAKRIRGHLDHPHPDLVAQYSTQSPSSIEESGLKEGEEEINEAYVRKFLIDNRVIRADLQEACVELLLSFHNHITKKP